MDTRKFGEDQLNNSSQKIGPKGLNFQGLMGATLGWL